MTTFLNFSNTLSPFIEIRKTIRKLVTLDRKLHKKLKAVITHCSARDSQKKVPPNIAELEKVKHKILATAFKMTQKRWNIFLRFSPLKNRPWEPSDWSPGEGPLLQSSLRQFFALPVFSSALQRRSRIQIACSYTNRMIYKSHVHIQIAWFWNILNSESVSEKTTHMSIEYKIILVSSKQDIRKFRSNSEVRIERIISDDRRVRSSPVIAPTQWSSHNGPRPTHRLLVSF
jgi:hypothetical protein